MHFPLLRGGQQGEPNGQFVALGEERAIAQPSCPQPSFFLSQSLREEPIHILNVAIQCADHMEDERLVPVFRAFVQSKVFPSCLWGQRTGCLDLCVAGNIPQAGNRVKSLWGGQERWLNG